MDANLNKGVWKAMENEWARALDSGKTVSVKIEPVYEGGTKRPINFDVSYKISGEPPKTTIINNTPGGI
jgi:filamentous hemagglutinin